MSYSTVRLGDIATVSSSKRIFARQYVPSGIPFYRQKEIIEKKNKVEISDPLFISKETFEDIKGRFGAPKKGDLLITAVGVTLGIPYVVGDEVFYFKDGNLIWLKDFVDGINSTYLYYWITSDIGQKSMWSRTIGSAQPALTIDTLKQFEIPVPEYEAQCRIADILSAYDALIDNNQNQMKLLEEAAQRLYKEWFVDLHFPGYEDTSIVEGVPEGWLFGSIGDIAEFKRGKTITKKQAVTGEIPVVAGGKEPAYWHNKANTGNPVITVSASGNAGFTRLYYQKVWASDCSYLDHDATENLFYVYLHLKYRQDDIYSMQKGACQQHVNAKEINTMKILIPANAVLQSFNEMVSPYFEKISSLEKQIQFATQARDRLLPKLMSGEIEVGV